METHDRLEGWVNQRIAGSQIPPGWPDEDSARRRLEQHIAARRSHRIVLWVGATAALCAALFVLPQPRAIAQRLWDRVFFGRVQVLITVADQGADPGLFSPDLAHAPEARPVATAVDASRAAGFVPRLPGLDLFATAPRYSVTDATSATLRLRTAAIRDLVVRAGGFAADVPDSWNDAVLEVRIGPVMIADYEGILLLQSLPFQLMTPPNFDLEAFYRIAFRSFGMSEQQARTLSADLSLSPAFLTFMPKEDERFVHEFTTRRGTGILMDGVYGDGKRLAVWSTPDRFFALFGTTAALSSTFVMEVANVLD
jgi:hypothetical protein